MPLLLCRQHLAQLLAQRLGVIPATAAAATVALSATSLARPPPRARTQHHAPLAQRLALQMPLLLVAGNLLGALRLPALGVQAGDAQARSSRSPAAALRLTGARLQD